MTEPLSTDAVLGGTSQPFSPMGIERAKEIASQCLKVGMYHYGIIDEEQRLPECSLMEMLQANHMLKSYREPNGKGGENIYMTVADRGIALHYAFEHFGRSPHQLLEALGYELTSEEG